MHPEGWKPLVDRLKSPFNIVLMVLAIVLVVDYLVGSPLMSRLVSLQLRLMGVDPTAKAMRLFTIFGTFTRVDVWTRFLERALIVILLVVPGLSYLGGFVTAVRGN
jgi:hypothetical protein